jgi:hypothetical protein
MQSELAWPLEELILRPGGISLAKEGRMKALILALAVFGTVVAASQNAKATTVVVREYNWDHPYWHHHHYGYWHQQRGYWAYRHGEHVFIAVP